jgi:DNA-binding NarL/FixJ family response regulator
LEQWKTGIHTFPVIPRFPHYKVRHKKIGFRDKRSTFQAHAKSILDKRESSQSCYLVNIAFFAGGKALEPKRILIVDDHPLFREGLKSILARNREFDVIAEAETGQEAFIKATEHSPDVAVIDITLPDTNGIELTRRIKEILPEVRVVMVTVHAKVNYIKEAFRAGATGYVVKESAADRLIQCLNAVSRGEYYIDSSLSQKIVDGLLAPETQDKGMGDDRYSALTAREQQVLRLVAEGLRSKDIAKKLDISPKTVETHRANLMSKLDLHSTFELVKYAARIGLIEMGQTEVE